MKTGILESSIEFIEQPFLHPLQISTGKITEATEARVSVRVQVGAVEATGRGSIYLSDLWAWPEPTIDRKTKDAAMRSFCQAVAQSLRDWCGGEDEHPLELGLRLHHTLFQPKGAAGMPLLARAVCASPFDAALHDAIGHALKKSAFRFYDTSAAIPSADHLFPGVGATEAIRRSLRAPVRSLDAWWLVSAKDDLEKVVRPAVEKNGIRCFKIKILAKDNQVDASRTVEVFRAARKWNLSPILSVDSNEGNPSAASVLEYLTRLESIDPEAYASLRYLEQPTARDIEASPNDWKSVAQRKPVMLDEGLTHFDLLPLAKEQGWSGFALKTCKGHSFSLVCAAWAQQNGMKLSLQDLTNPGYSAIHSFLFGSYVPTMNGVELNSPQYTPAANQPWLPQLSSLLEPQEGQHRLNKVNAFGLGSSLVSAG